MITLLLLDSAGRCHGVGYPVNDEERDRLIANWEESFPDRKTYSLPGFHRISGKEIFHVKNDKIEVDEKGEPITDHTVSLSTKEEISLAKERFLLSSIKESVSNEARSKIESRLKQISQATTM